MKINKKAHTKGNESNETDGLLNSEKTLSELITEDENTLTNTEETKENAVINFDEIDLEMEGPSNGTEGNIFNNPFETETESKPTDEGEVFNLDSIMEEPLTKVEPKATEEVAIEKPKKESKFSSMKVGKKAKKEIEPNLDDLLVGIGIDPENLLTDDGEEITLADIKSELNDKAHNYKNNVKWWEKGFNIGALSVVTVLMIVVGYQFGVVDLITDGYSHIQLLLGNANIDGRAKELTDEAKTEIGISTESIDETTGETSDSAVLELTPEEIEAMQAAEEAAKLTDTQLAAQAEAESIAKETGTVLPGRYVIGQSIEAGLYYAGTGTYSVWNSETDIKINIAPSVRMVNYGKLVTFTDGQVLQFSAGTLVKDETRPNRQVTTLTPGDDFVVGKDLVLGEYEIINPAGRDNPIMLAVIPAEGDTYSIRIQEKTYKTFAEGDILSPEGQLSIYNVN